MIIQCDQCDTKFRLDDTKIPDKGVKVRCAKCKNIFFVQKEAPAEETDFDALLNGLGAPSAEKDAGTPQGDEPPPGGVAENGGAGPGDESGSWGADASGSDDGAAAFAAEEDRSTSDFPAKGGPEPQQEDASAEEFPFAMGGEVAPQGAEPAASVEKGGGDVEFGEFSFDGKGTDADIPEQEGSSPQQTDEFDFGSVEFSHEEPHEAMEQGEAQSPSQADEFDFGSVEFSQEETAAVEVPEQEPPAPPQADEFDFGSVEFSQEETAAVEVPGQEPPAPPQADEFDFGSVEFSQEETAAVEAPEHEADAGQQNDEFDFGEPEPEIAAPAAVEVPLTADVAATENEATSDALDYNSQVDKAMAEEPLASETPKQAAIPPVVPEKWEAVPPPSKSIASEDEELPPLAISSRSKSSVFPVALTSVAIILVLAIAGIGFYVAKEGSAAFDKLGLSFLAKWIGMESSGDEKIKVVNPQGAFMTNGEAGEIFVVSGKAVNNFKQARASIQVKATILGPKGESLMEKVAFCGNELSKEQLATLPMAKIEEAMASPFGDALSNLSVPPGKEVPFMVVFSGVPRNAGEFSVQVIGSTLANE